jgi:hypothetical protein
MILLVLAFFAGGKAEVHVAFKSGKVVFFELVLASYLIQPFQDLS